MINHSKYFVLQFASNFEFVLKIIADIGLIGFPNSGKSSLTNLITNAQTKTGNYPFTTLNPNIGIIKSKTNIKAAIKKVINRN